MNFPVILRDETHPGLRIRDRDEQERLAVCGRASFSTSAPLTTLSTDLSLNAADCSTQVDSLQLVKQVKLRYR